MTIKIVTANRQNYGNMRQISAIKYIVVHYTGNDGDTDTGNANYFKNNIAGASAHYFVDDDSVTQSVPDNYIAWAVGGNKYADCAKTGGGTMYKLCTNTNSISIELCDTVRDGVSAFTDATVNRAVELIRLLMAKYNVDIDHVIRHFDVVGKICPKPFIDGGKWADFKNKIVGDDIDMATAAELEKRIADLEEKSKEYNMIGTGEMPTWIEELAKWGRDNGIIKGTGSGWGMTEIKAQNLAMLKALYEKITE